MDKLLIVDAQNSDISWIEFIEKNRYNPFESILNLLIEVNLRFIQPYQIVLLACLIEEYSLAGIPINFKRNASLANEYLEYIRFFEYWEKNFNRNLFTRAKKNTTLALWKISQAMISAYADQSQKYYENLFFEGKDLSALHIALTEVFNNIYDHAQSAIEGFVLTQYYPHVQKINVAICDFGVGIPTKINSLWIKGKEKVLADEEALRVAFMNRVSTQTTPQNRGYGLANLLGNIRNTNGDLSVYSNKAMIHFTDKSSYLTKDINSPLGGTLVKFSFDPNNLPLKETEVDNEEYFF